MLLNPFLAHLSLSEPRPKHYSQAVPRILETRGSFRQHLTLMFCQTSVGAYPGPEGWARAWACFSWLICNVPFYSWTLHSFPTDTGAQCPSSHFNKMALKVLLSIDFQKLASSNFAVRRMIEYGTPLTSLLVS